MIDTDKVLIGLGQHISGRTPQRCVDCPYFNGDSGYGVSCRDELLDDIYELLEAREEAQEPRVMTLEEVKMLDSDYYYLESMRSPGKELREIVGAYGLTCVTWPSITWARQTMGDRGYGKTWRCWSSRPDEKRRAETPWN